MKIMSMFSWFWKLIKVLEWLILEWSCQKTNDMCKVLLWFIGLVPSIIQVLSFNDISTIFNQRVHKT